MKDVSAKIWRCRNKLIKAVFMLGTHLRVWENGIGGKGRKQSKGVGIRSMSDVDVAGRVMVVGRCHACHGRLKFA